MTCPDTLGTMLTSAKRRPQGLGILCAAILVALAVSGAAHAGPVTVAPDTTAACVALSSPGQIASPTVIAFDDLPVGTSIGEFYRRTHGVRFEEGRTARVIAYDHPLPRSAPMVAMSQTDGDPVPTALNFYFDAAQVSVGLFLGNGGGATTARLQGFDADGNQICAAEVGGVPDGHTAFIGFRDDTGRIVSVSLLYVASAQAESMDDLHFSSAAAPTATPTRTATSVTTRTATASATRTTTSTPTRTPTPTPTHSASSAAALFVFPAAVAQGGEPAVSGYGFPALADLRLILACPGARTEFDLGAARADAAGRLRTTVIMSAYPPNPCLLAARQGATILAETALTVLPALELTFSPQGGPPGTEVSFTVRNLVAGDLRLDYAGLAVVGPLRTAGGSYTGAFMIPGDRPTPLGSMAEVQASNLLLGRAVGAATGSFRSQAGPIPPAYRVIDLQLPGAAHPAGSEFTLTGRINPAPQGPLERFQIIPVWRKADGRTLPIGREPARIAADGAFDVRMRVPSLLTGDPTWPETGDLVGVILLAPAHQPQPFLQTIADPPAFPKFAVKVVDAQTQQLISAAKVSFQVWDYKVSAGSLGQVAGQAMTGGSNQVGQVLGTTELTDDEKAMIALTKALCIPIGIPIGQTKWEVTSPILDQALSEPSVQGLIQQSSIIVGATGTGAGGLLATEDRMAAGDVIPYLLTVNALDAGYGLKDADGAVKNLSLRVNFHLTDLTYRDLKGNILPNPYIVALGKLSSGDQSALGPIGVFVAGIGAPELPSPTSFPRFDRYYSAKNLPAGVQVTKLADGTVTVSLSQPQYHKLGAGGMKLYVDGTWVADILLQFNPGLVCNKFKGTQPVSAPFYYGKAVIPNAHLLPSGVRSLVIKAQLAVGSWVSYNYGLKVDPVPATWFAVPTAGTRVLTWKPGEITLSTPWLKAETNSQLLTSGAETDETGPLDNRTQPNVNFSQKATANGHKGAQTSGQVAGQAINRDGKGCSINNCPPNTAAIQSATLESINANPVTSYTYGPHKEDVVPEVKYNIPGFVAGIPFVASVEVGGVIKYSASVTYGGEVTVYDDGSVRAKAKITPLATVGGGMYISGQILSGLITADKAELTANMSVAMPITYDSATNTVDTGNQCFRYFSELYTWSGWLCIPFTDICAWDDSDTETLFDGRSPDGCQVTTAAVDAAATSADVKASTPPFGLVSLASNGHGQVMAIWQQTRTSLATSFFDGATWSVAQTIATGLGSTQPQIAFLAPNRGVAVWTESSLTEAQLPGLTTLPDVLHAQRIAYATWDGAAWSAGQPLTTPSRGEGGATLAACPEWQPGCPAGGAAVAVWERNLSDDLNARNIRLYYAQYQGSAWSAAQAVDGAGAFTDILPQAAYVNGVPLVAWVRDADADLTDASSRRIALRFLNGGVTFTPAELPAAIGEVALGVAGNGAPILAFTQLEDPRKLLGNQRPLWIAGVTCSGPTTCAWQPRKVTDASGRTLYAERPLLTMDAAGQPAITFRGLGFGGGQPDQAGDPPGMTYNLGELAQVTVNPATGQAAPAYLTQDGAVNWLPAAAYDPLLNATVALAVKAAPPAVFGANATGQDLAQASGLRFNLAPDLPIVAAVAPGLPDFALADAALSGGPATGEPLRLVARIANTGTAWPGSADLPLAIKAAWDDAPGIGVAAGQVTLTSLGPAPFVTVTLDLTPPAAGLDAPHELYIAVNPGLAIPETDGANNRQILSAGGILPPVGLWAQVEPGSSLMFLGWETVVDRRVAGYRVYRAEAGGEWQPLGASFAPGYVDLTASAGRAYRYAVAAYTADGGDSPLGPQFSVGARPLRIYLPLVERGVGRP